MAHQSLYRKYRPQGFSDVVGQKHVTRTLSNAVDEGATAHAYLFTGPRGTGKTTTARILAKALNCEKGPTSMFDDTCPNCVDITQGRHPDVYELDAASRTGVDAIRDEIVNKVNYAATRGGYKVYIIDEVHMLSTSAFNAMLKTLEEPPSHTVFVLCTTHPNKVPETIQSRCQRFDFKRISVEDIVERLQLIADAEKIAVAEGALTLIARHAAGGMRDAISTLDQLAAFTGRSVTLDDVEGLLGEVDSALLFGAADLVLRRDVAGAFRFVAVLSESGVDVAEFVKGLTGHIRDLYVIAEVGDATGVVEATDEGFVKLSAQAAEFGPERLARILDVLGQLTTDLRWAGDARLALEVALVRMARPEGDLTLEGLEERMRALESGAALAAPVPPAPPMPPARPAPPPASPRAGKPKAERDVPKEDASDGPSAEAPAPIEEAPPEPPTPRAAETYAPRLSSVGSLDRAKVKRAWPAVVAEVKKAKTSRAQLFTVTEVDVDGDTLVVEFPKDQQFALKLAEDPDTLQLLRRAVATVLGVKPPVRYQLGRGAVRPVETPPLAPDEAADPPTGEVDGAAAADPPGEADDGAGLEKMLIDELGAEEIVEHRHDEKKK